MGGTEWLWLGSGAGGVTNLPLLGVQEVMSKGGTAYNGPKTKSRSSRG